eukprot:s1614_g12.t1
MCKATAIVGHEMSQEAWDESQMLTMQVVTGVQGLLERLACHISVQTSFRIQAFDLPRPSNLRHPDLASTTALSL